MDTLETIKVSFLNNNYICKITLNRPKALNALNRLMLKELHYILDLLTLAASGYNDHISEELRQVRVVIFTGEGRAFCAGADIKGTFKPRRYTLHDQRMFSDIILKIYRLPQATIASIKGPASGGGFAIALVCDIRVVGKSTTFDASFLKLGLTAELGSTWLLPRIVGLAHSNEILMTARTIDAKRSLHIGLVNSLVDDDSLNDATMNMANDMLKLSRKALLYVKKSIQASQFNSLEAQIDMEDRGQITCLNDSKCMNIAMKRVEELQNKKKRSKL